MGTVSFWIDNKEEEKLEKFCKDRHINVSMFIKIAIYESMKLNKDKKYLWGEINVRLRRVHKNNKKYAN